MGDGGIDESGPVASDEVAAQVEAENMAANKKPGSGGTQTRQKRRSLLLEEEQGIMPSTDNTVRKPTLFGE
jgi:hypothetical protein